jgi:serine/threonine protein kinase
VREARAAAQLRHPNVASVFHLGMSGDAYFYAMEFVDGETVESLIKRGGPVDPALALHITLQVTRALGAARKHHLVHRDIKPANLMLVKEDDDYVVKVIDFGLAKSIRRVKIWRRFRWAASSAQRISQARSSSKKRKSTFAPTSIRWASLFGTCSRAAPRSADRSRR